MFEKFDIDSLGQNPFFTAGISLLGAGLGGSPNPYQAAFQGFQGGLQARRDARQSATQMKLANSRLKMDEARLKIAQDQAAFQKQRQTALIDLTKQIGGGTANTPGYNPHAPDPNDTNALFGLAAQAGPEGLKLLDAYKGFNKPAERQITTDANGRRRYVDSGEFVFPDVEVSADETFETVDSPFGRGGVGQRNRQTGQIVNYQKPQEHDAGPFEGSGLDNQLLNILLDPNADTSSPVYRAAYNRLADTRTTYDPATNQQVSITPNMSAFRAPTGSDDLEVAAGSPSPQTPGGVSVSKVEGVDPKLTKEQTDAATYAERLSDANGVIGGLETLGAEQIGTITGSDSFPNVFKSDERQQLEQAQRNFVNAVLRRESGAVISSEEFENASKQYFPVPGDSAAVIAQKRQNRLRALEGMQRAAGPAQLNLQSEPASNSHNKRILEEYSLDELQEMLQLAEEPLDAAEVQARTTIR